MLAGACITACRGTGRHIVALEGNKDIYEAILKPMRKSAVETSTVPPIVDALDDLVDMPVVAHKFIRKGKFSK